MNAPAHFQWSSAVNRCRRLLNGGVLVENLFHHLPACLIASIGLTLVVLLALQKPSWRPLAILPLGASLILAWQRSRRRFFTNRQAAAWLDARHALHGLGTLAQDGVPLSAPLGQNLARGHFPPRLHWRWMKLLRPAIAPVLTLLVLQLIPWKTTSPSATRSIPIHKQIRRQLERIQTLEKTGLLPGRELDGFKREIEDLNRAAGAYAGDPPTLEAADRLSEQLAKSESNLLNQLRSCADAVNSLQQFAVTGKAMETWQSAELKTQTAELLQKMKDLGLDSDPALSQLNNKELAEIMRAYLAGANAELPKNPGELQNMLDTMRQWLKTKADKASQCQLGAGCSDHFITETEAERQALKSACSGVSGQPGKGGNDRGRADAELTYGDETRLDDKAFQARLLPDGASPSADQSLTLSIQALPPKATPLAGAATPSSSAAASTAKTEGHGAAVLLRHRETVRRYFTQPTPPSK
ncbi:MAG: hypothetical protein PHV34_07330 [Verrucomicrobiae bacterium]|nr:hypothetical protein [Verrucomicrobiae bacterium]